MSTNSFVLQSQRSISKQNLFRNSFNLVEQKSQKSKQGDLMKPRSQFSSCVNLLGQKISDKRKERMADFGANGPANALAASTIFDQLKNAQMMPTKAPSITSKSNNERSTHNLLKNSQSLQGLTDMNPQQAYELMHKMFKHDPEKLKLLIKETQHQQSTSSLLQVQPIVRQLSREKIA